jgi:hypothetical protein
VPVNHLGKLARMLKNPFKKRPPSIALSELESEIWDFASIQWWNHDSNRPRSYGLLLQEYKQLSKDVHSLLADGILYTPYGPVKIRICTPLEKMLMNG